MREAELCKKCVHSNVCFKDKNLFGDVFIAGNPMLFDNKELFKKYKEREAQGFPCDDFMEVVRCKECKHFMPLTGYSLCVAHGSDAVDADDFCSWAERKETEDDSVTK